MLPKNPFERFLYVYLSIACVSFVAGALSHVRLLVNIGLSLMGLAVLLGAAVLLIAILVLVCRKRPGKG